jgi:predicted metal-dependent enzyme (double-stranded beta helix superfamily)
MSGCSRPAGLGSFAAAIVLSPHDEFAGRIDREMTPNEFITRCTECLAHSGSAVDIALVTRQALVSQRERSDLWGKVELLHCSDDLMIVDLTLPPFATSAIHDHQTWAVVGVSEGCEIDELFEEHSARLRWSARHQLRAGDVLELGSDCIHFIANPLATVTRGIHVYGRDLRLTQRRMWHPETGAPKAMDFAVFEEWERMLTARSAVNGAIVAPTANSS